MKTKMTVTLKNFFPPKEGQYGLSQGAYIITDRGQFKAYNTGPVWFSTADKDQALEVMGEWKQNQSTKVWYLACNYGKVQQGPQPAQQGPQQAVQSPNDNKDRVIVAQVAYKGLAEVAAAAGSSVEDFLKLALGNHIKHITDKIMEAGGVPIPEEKPVYKANPDYVGDDPPPPADNDPLPF